MPKLYSLFFLFFNLFSIIHASEIVCPSGFQLINQNKCLKLFSTNLKHLEAELTCTSYGGTLVNINNAIDNRAVSNLAASTSATSIWIGTFCFSSRDISTCYNDNGSGNLTYTNFAAGYPNVGEGYGGCVSMQTSGPTAGKWISAPCEVAGMPFVCEVPATVADPTCTHNYNGYCYTPSHEMPGSSPSASFFDAEKICFNGGSKMVSIHSKREIDYIREIYKDSEVTNQITLGAFSYDSDVFNWVDSSRWNFDYFDPLDMSFGDCLGMDLSEEPNSGMWTRVNCSTSNYFLCKRKITSTVPTKEAENLQGIPPNPDPFDFSHCNTTLYLAPGQITSLGYPISKPPAAYCTWKLATVGAYRLGIYFTDISVAKSVYIYDEYGNLLADPSGNLSPFKVLAPTNIMTITHDGSSGDHGFSATFLSY
ncbi:hypothetical protein CRE_14502 [Caenorhabditis remanei]|uniref:C-type LECtin n=1 Tax=Caenorhabditis remanei TaxID=31234 RepID=E3M987_CAERE|nr:hypothetical protein CRE_14502 [Caenorhabditis remanei]